MLNVYFSALKLEWRGENKMKAIKLSLILLTMLIISMVCIAPAVAGESIIEDTTCVFKETELPDGSYLFQYQCIVDINEKLLDKEDIVTVVFEGEDLGEMDLPKKGCFVNDLYYVSYEVITDTSIGHAVNCDTNISIHDKNGVEIESVIDKELFSGFTKPSIVVLTHDVWESNANFWGFGKEYSSRLEITLVNKDSDRVVFAEGDIDISGEIYDYIELYRLKLEPGESITIKTRTTPYFLSENPEKMTIRINSGFETLSLDYWENL